jgi:5-methylcytosine-specific restriction endonuclease McrA
VTSGGTGGVRPRFLGSHYIRREFDGRPCPYCGVAMRVDTPTHPTKDHLRPRTRGGTLESCIVVCERCNHDKSELSLFRFLQWLEERGDPRARYVQRFLVLPRR